MPAVVLNVMVVAGQKSAPVQAIQLQVVELAHMAAHQQRALLPAVVAVLSPIGGTEPISIAMTELVLLLAVVVTPSMAHVWTVHFNRDTA